MTAPATILKAIQITKKMTVGTNGTRATKTPLTWATLLSIIAREPIQVSTSAKIMRPKLVVAAPTIISSIGAMTNTRRANQLQPTSQNSFLIRESSPIPTTTPMTMSAANKALFMLSLLRMYK